MASEVSQTARKRGLGDLSVNLKVLGAVTLALLVAVLVGVVGLRALGETNAATQQIYKQNMASDAALGQVRAAELKTRMDAAMHAASLNGSPMKQKFRAAIDKDLAAFDAAIQIYHDSGPAGDPATLEAMVAGWRDYTAILKDKMIPASDRGDITGWGTIRDSEAIPVITAVEAELDDLHEAEVKDAARAAAHAQSSYASNRTRALALLTAGVLIALGLGIAVARGIVRSLNRVKAVCRSLSEGDLTQTVGLTNGDEVGQMGRALDDAMGTLRKTMATINDSAISLAGASEQMSGVSAQIASSAEEASAQAQAVSAAAEQVSRSVHTVSASSEEMGASIEEIARNANEAARVASDAVSVADETNATVSKLGESSIEIGNVVKTITSIAEQTNLLALNATIEAARAGEAGKGFAVVATEVKDLAQETARATEDIARRVEAIQADTSGAVQAISQISSVIERISDFQTTIASAVEEQTATTGETTRSVSEAATGVEGITSSIGGVAESARITSQGVTESQQTAVALARMSNELSGLVSNFRY